MEKIKILIIDDNDFIHTILSVLFKSDDGFEIIGTAKDGIEGLEKIKSLNPDVITCDLEMPRMDGLELLSKVMTTNPKPIVMVSSFTPRGAKATIKALSLGAVACVPKADSSDPNGLENFTDELLYNVKLASKAQLKFYTEQQPPPVTECELEEVSPEDFATNIIVFGASTGGVEAIITLFGQIKFDLPGIVIVMYLDTFFIPILCNGIKDASHFNAKEAQDGDVVEPNTVLISSTDKLVRVTNKNGKITLNCIPKEERSADCLPIDYMMQSVANSIGKDSIGVILTGDGEDGAIGLKAMYKAGAGAFVQDKASCMISTMSKKALAVGGTELSVPLDEIASTICRLTKLK